MVLGWLTLPYSHFRWFPNLGTTRPLSAFFFTLSFILIFISKTFRKPFHWTRLAGIDFFKEELRSLPGWKFLRWWLILVALGLVSAVLTLFYGTFLQALNRLLGYAIIFLYLYCALYSLRAYGLERIARWISIGYIPVLPYAIIEAIATRNIPWAYQIIMFVRNATVVPFGWGYRVAFLATEPSFAAFQLVLLITIWPHLKSKVLRITNLLLILLSVAFSVSMMVFGLLLAYIILISWLSLSAKSRFRLVSAICFLILAGFVVLLTSPVVEQKVLSFLHVLATSNDYSRFRVSPAIRFSYILVLFYVVVDTYGLGLGIGQYGYFWKEFYQRHIDYKIFDIGGEVSRALASTVYMRPWSLVLGIGSDLGLVGLLLFSAFLYQIYRYCQSPHARAIVLVSFLALMGAYPIVTPHEWLALALMGGCGASNIIQRSRT